MIIDGKDLILGRLSTIAAKKALLGEAITIINCKDVIITGKKQRILQSYQRKRALGTHKGPLHPRLPEQVVKRTIRGMLPYKQPKGRDAFNRIRCYRGTPAGMAGQEAQPLPGAHKSKLRDLNYLDLGTLAKLLGARQ